MALTTDELKVIIAADATRFRAEMAQVQSQLRQLQTTTTSTGDAFGKNLFGSFLTAQIGASIIIGTFRKASQAIGGVTNEIISGGTAYTRLRIATETVARNVGITRTQLQGLRQDLIEANTWGIAAETTIKTLALSGLYKMSQQLKAVDARTGETRKGVSALVLTMKDLAAAAGIESTEAIDRLTAFIQTGRMQVVDGIIEVGRITFAYKEMAKQLGKNVADLTAVEQAQARLNIVMVEGQKTFGAYANTMQTAGKLAESVQAQLKFMAQLIGSNLSPAFDTFAKGLFILTSGLLGHLVETQASIRQFAVNVAGIFAGLFRTLGAFLSLIPGLGTRFQQLANFTVKATTGMTQAGKAASGAAGGIKEAAKATGDLRKQLAGLAGFDELNTLQEQAQGLGDALGTTTAGSSGVGEVGGDIGLSQAEADAINARAEEIVGSFRDLRRSIDDLLRPLKETTIFGTPLLDLLGQIAVVALGVVAAIKIVGVVLGVVGAAIGVLTSPVLLVVGAVAALIVVGKLLYDNFQPVRDLLDGIVLSVQNFSKKIQEFVQSPPFQAFLKIMAEIGRNIMANIQRALEALGKVIQERIVPAWNRLMEAVKPIVEAVLPVLGTIVGGLLIGLGKLAEFLSLLLAPAFELIGTVIGVVIDAVANVIRWIVDLYKRTFESVQNAIKYWNLFRQSVETVFNAVKAIIQSVLSSIASWIQDRIDTITGAFGKVKSTAETIFKGVRQTIEAAFTTAVQFVKDRINDVIRTINRAIGFINTLISGVNSIPGVNIGQVGSIPLLAAGGVVNSPTMAMLGEAGREAVVPLDRSDWMDELAKKIGGGNQPIQLVVKLGEETVYSRLVDYLNDRSLSSTSPLLKI